MINQALVDFGFSTKEAAVYAALLQMGQGTVGALATQTKLPRATIYRILDDLGGRGVVSAYDEGKIKTFAPQPPTALLNMLEARVQSFKTALPALKEAFASSAVQPQIRYFVGRDAIRGMYQDLLHRRGLKQYDIFAAESEWLDMDRHFFTEFKKQRAKQGITTRMIVEDSDTARQRKNDEQATLSKVKILPPAFSPPFHGGCYILPDTVIFVAYRKEHVAVEIISPEITSVVQTMFNFAWQFLAG